MVPPHLALEIFFRRIHKSDELQSKISKRDGLADLFVYIGQRLLAHAASGGKKWASNLRHDDYEEDLNL